MSDASLTPTIPVDEFFGFSHRPFRGTPAIEDYVPVESMQQEITRLAEAATQGDGIAVMTAPPGTGKTLACLRLQEELSVRFEAAVLTSSGFATRRSLLQAILFALGQDYQSFSEQELRLSVLNYARRICEQQDGIVLIVDEAHLLNIRLLEELRCLTNHTESGKSLLRVILVGQLPLEDALTNPSLQALNYRITCYTTLEPFSMQESADLIRGRLRNAGQAIDDLFTDDALETICRVSDGNPRCVIQLTDSALTLAAQHEERTVTAETVRVALRELKQLPLQWNDSAVDACTSCESTDIDSTDFSSGSIASTSIPTSSHESVADVGEWESAASMFELDAVDARDDALSTSDVVEPQDAFDTATNGWASFESTAEPEGSESVSQEEYDHREGLENVLEDGEDIFSADEEFSTDEEPAVSADWSTFDPSSSDPSAFDDQHDGTAIPSENDAPAQPVELDVDDHYAQLEREIGRVLPIETSENLVNALETTLPPHCPSPTPEGAEAQEHLFADILREPDVSPEQRIDDVIAAIDSVTVDDGARDEHSWEEPVSTAEWQEEDVVNDASASQDPAIGPVPTSPQTATHEAPTATEDRAKRRPYASLFSRLRRRQAS